MRNIEFNSCLYEDKMSGKKVKVRIFIIEVIDIIELVMIKECYRWVRDKMLLVYNGFRLVEKVVLLFICVFFISNIRLLFYCYY